MAGYSGTPLWKKLGLKQGRRLLTSGAPPGWRLPEQPEGVAVAPLEQGPAEATGSADEILIAFFATRAQLAAELPALARRSFPEAALWIAWPRRVAGHESDILDQDIRDLALPLGLVDVKVAAIEEDWSGLRLVWRRELRSGAVGAITPPAPAAG
jgi:hypothetical protein